MLIVSVRDNENKRWKRNAKQTNKQQTNKNRKEQRETEAIVEFSVSFINYLKTKRIIWVKARCSGV